MNLVRPSVGTVREYGNWTVIPAGPVSGPPTGRNYVLVDWPGLCQPVYSRRPDGTEATRAGRFVGSECHGPLLSAQARVNRGPCAEPALPTLVSAGRALEFVS